KPEEHVLSSESKGRQYFLAKKQLYEAQQDFYTLQGSESQNLVDLITQSYPSMKIITAPGTESRIYLLVNFQEEPLLIERVLHWQKACPRWELQLGQVSPPYHFT
ncbi:MAG: gas vesicle protein, partial [Microcystis aeruginosa]